VSIATAVALEWSRLRRDAVVWTAIAVLTVALAYGLGNGYAWQRFQREAIAQAATLEQATIAAARSEAQRLDRLAGQEIDPFSDPRHALGFESEYLQQYDCLQPTPLAMMAVGQSDLLPYCVRVTTGPWPSFVASYEWENPLRLLLGRFDCAFVVIYLLPLLILAISFNVLSRERELGTLPLLFSYPVTPRRWLAVGLGLRAALLIGVTIAVALAGLWWTGADPTGAPSLLRFGLWAAAVGAYALFWFGLAWWVNARRKSSAVNALTLAGAWLLLVILAPALLNAGVKQVYPLPSRVAFINALRNATAESEKEGSGLLKKYMQDHPELAPGDPAQAADDYVRVLLAVNAQTERVLAPSQQRFQQQIDRQQRLIDRLSVVSPAILVQQAGNAVSGTDQRRHLRFLESVARHRLEVKAFFDPKFVADDRFDAYDGIPKFRPDDVPLPDVARTVLSAVILLCLLTALCVVMGWRALRRPLFEP